MNFSPFGGHFPTAIPTIHQFAAKFSSQEAAAGALCPQDNSSNRYTANGVPSFTQHHPATQQQMINTSKYQSSYINQNIYTGHQAIRQENKRPSYEQQELAQELCAAMLQQNQQQDKQQTNDGKHSKESQENERRNHQQQQQQQLQQHQVQQPNVQTHTATTSMPSTWQSLAAPGSTVADYLSHLPASTLPLSLHHFLKYSAENIKKETAAAVAANQHSIQGHTSLQEANLNLLHHNNTLNGLGGPAHALHPNGNPPNNPINPLSTLSTINTAQIHGGAPLKKKKKKKQEKEKKPRPKPGEIRLTTALDGSTLYCCPECHMAYPEKELLEQHLVGHTLERRFVCDICGAGLKRKDHLTRHKQSHNPERPYVCTVCLKAFKRKEQLTLHFVIHSGEKRHVCTECGKGFYRKDHLRKHTRSHIARRVKAELSQQTLQLPVAPSSSTNATQGILS